MREYGKDNGRIAKLASKLMTGLYIEQKRNKIHLSYDGCMTINIKFNGHKFTLLMDERGYERFKPLSNKSKRKVLNSLALGYLTISETEEYFGVTVLEVNANNEFFTMVMCEDDQSVIFIKNFNENNEGMRVKVHSVHNSSTRDRITITSDDYREESRPCLAH